MLISCRITSGVPNKCSTQLIFDGVDLTMLRAKEVINIVLLITKCMRAEIKKLLIDLEGPNGASRSKNENGRGLRNRSH